MAATDEELELIKKHPIFLRAEKKYNRVWNAVARKAHLRAERLEQKEQSRHMAAMEKIRAIRDKGHDDGARLAHEIEHNAWEAALADIRAKPPKKAKCPDCGGKGGFDYEESASCNHMNTRRTWRPCQTCNLRAFGITDAEV